MRNQDPETVDLAAVAAAADSTEENAALAQLRNPDLPPETFERLAKSSIAAKSRKVKLAIIHHQKSPRYVSLAVLRQLFTFDLMQVALAPVVAGDLKIAAEEILVRRLEAISAGEKLSLARRASGRVACELLLDPEPRIFAAALGNPRLTEALLIKAIQHASASEELIQAVCAHSKWSLRREVRTVLLRNQYTPSDLAVEFAAGLADNQLAEVLQNSQLPESIKKAVAGSAPDTAYADATDPLPRNNSTRA